MKKLPVTGTNMSTQLTSAAFGSAVEKVTDLAKHAISEKEQTKRTESNNKTAETIAKFDSDTKIKIADIESNERKTIQVADNLTKMGCYAIEKGDDRKFDKTIEQMSRIVDSLTK